ncbi:hypothetical protein BC940DRAFT_98651 [Gongronella butleri]|nr:hypothetical protein BC940DRAFT_98651 [Gongronella butleri]
MTGALARGLCSCPAKRRRGIVLAPLPMRNQAGCCRPGALAPAGVAGADRARTLPALQTIKSRFTDRKDRPFRSFYLMITSSTSPAASSPTTTATETGRRSTFRPPSHMRWWWTRPALLWRVLLVFGHKGEQEWEREPRLAADGGRMFKNGGCKPKTENRVKRLLFSFFFYA